MIRTVPPVPLRSKSLYTFYREQPIPKVHRITGRDNFLRVVGAIYKVAAKRLIENKAGVVLDGLGYMGHWESPEKKIFRSSGRTKSKKILNYFSDFKWINTGLFRTRKTDVTGWTFDRTFNKKIKHGRMNQTKKGHKYLFYYNMVKGVYWNNEIYDKYR